MLGIMGPMKNKSRTQRSGRPHSLQKAPSRSNTCVPQWGQTRLPASASVGGGLAAAGTTTTSGIVGAGLGAVGATGTATTIGMLGGAPCAGWPTVWGCGVAGCGGVDAEDEEEREETDEEPLPAGCALSPWPLHIMQHMQRQTRMSADAPMRSGMLVPGTSICADPSASICSGASFAASPGS